MSKRAKPTTQRRTARPTEDWQLWAWGALLVALVAAVYGPSLANGFIWDDDFYVQNNEALRSSQGLRDIWFKLGTVPQYYPLVHTTFWAEYHLWGLDPRGYHVVNLLLHAASAVLLWRLLVTLEVPGAWLGAALFAVHPVQVESVAWVTERKNVLSCVLALGSILAYLRFIPFGATDRQSPREWKWYALALALFVGALLSKTVTVSLPAVLLVVYWWKRGRLTLADLVPLVPFFLVGIALALVTVYMERTHVGAKGQDWDYTFIERTLLAGRVLWFYAAKLVWPYPLIFFYPKWTIDAADPLQWLYPLGALALVVSLYLLRDRLGRGPLAAVLIFGGVLFPALGYFNVYPFLYSWVADHFQYHASIALLALFGAALATAAIRWQQVVPRWAGAIAAGALLVVLATVAERRTHAYFDLSTLWQDTVEQNPSSWAAHNNLGVLLQSEGKIEEASAHYRQAMDLLPKEDWHRNMGSALYLTGRLDEAAEQLRRVLAQPLDDAGRSRTLIDLGSILLMQNRLDEAIRCYQQAIDVRKGAEEHLSFEWRAWYNYAEALVRQEKYAEAVDKYRTALELNPTYAEGHHALGLALAKLGRTAEAVAEFNQALKLHPSSTYHESAAAALLAARNLAAAESHLKQATLLNPASANAYNLLGVVAAQQGDLDKAIASFRTALGHDPANSSATNNLQKALEAQSKSQPPKAKRSKARP